MRQEKKRTNKWGNPYQNEPTCACDKQTSDNMFFGGYKKEGIEKTSIYSHCLRCGGRIWHENQ